jgi:sortase (surface protein transpeptidase)
MGVFYFAADVFKSAPELKVYSPPAPTFEATIMAEIQPKTLAKSEPVKVSIPDIGLDTQLTTVGKQPDGTLEVPVSANTPGWYRLSPTPGELGPAVIVGHVDSPKGPAVFWRLRELTPGKFVEVSRADGSIVKFKITEVKQFEQNNFPTNEVYGNVDHAALRLITCGGSYNKLTGNYSHNTVIFAVLEA